MKLFNVGKTYEGRSVCDSSCIFRFTVERRTRTTITTTEGKTFRISVRDDYEFVRPMGNYSMAPIIKAGV
jgi:hypothetical protein